MSKQPTVRLRVVLSKVKAGELRLKQEALPDEVESIVKADVVALIAKLREVADEHEKRCGISERDYAKRGRLEAAASKAARGAEEHRRRLADFHEKRCMWAMRKNVATFAGLKFTEKEPVRPAPPKSIQNFDLEVAAAIQTRVAHEMRGRALGIRFVAEALNGLL